MPSVTLLQQRLSAIADNLKQHPQGLALLGLGSAGKELSRMDQWSDLDFFAIVAEGHKQQFIDDLSWLSETHPIAWCFKNTADGYKLLFEDGVFCEFAVFEPQELAHIPYSEGEFVYKDDCIADALKTPRVKSHSQSEDESFLLGELLTNLYVGLCRYHRGERCSAMRFVQVYAVDRLINLLDLSESGNDQIFQDEFCPDRRVEQRHALHQQLIKDCCQGSENSPASAKTMLEFVAQHYQVNPDIETEIRKLL